MCGFTGFFGFNNSSMSNVFEQIKIMSKTIIHRGPNDDGIWIDEKDELALAHRRLSIQDISKAGHQPMLSSNKRFVIVFNGEIYNHLYLRNYLKKKYPNINWSGNSDTETLISLIEYDGLLNTLNLISGMFSFALWDKKLKRLSLARDRAGEKPLYFGWQNNTLLFGSELKAIKAYKSFSKEIDRNSISSYLRNNYIPAPYTIYKNIFKLHPGSYITFDLKNRNKNLNQKKYWSILNNKKKNETSLSSLNLNENTNHLEKIFFQVIKEQMISDVPIGAFLSGGIDSSLVTAIMQSISEKPINTFTVGFDDNEFNEAKYALKISKYLKTNHHEIFLKDNDLLDVIPKISGIYDEPFSDSSQIPTYMISNFASKKVTVSLSGDGADELFGGYNRYLKAYLLFNQLKKLPINLRSILFNLINSLNPNHINLVGKLIGKLSLDELSWGKLDYKLSKFSKTLMCNTMMDYYNVLTSNLSNPNEIVIGGKEHKNDFVDFDLFENHFDQSKLMQLDFLNYLHNDILVKLDRASMASSLECRSPFLDIKIINFATELPLNMKINNKKGKVILRELLNKFIPKNLFERSKSGFAVPISRWLNGPLKDWSEELLDFNRIKSEGLLNPIEVQKLKDAHLSGRKNHQDQLWSLLIFQQWVEDNKL